MHLLKLRLVAPVVSTSKPAAFPGGRRTFKYLVQQSGIAKSSRFPVVDHTTQRELFEKTWTLSGSRPLEKLKLHLPGVAFISSVDSKQDLDDNHLAKIRVTSDSVHVLEGVGVESKFPYRTILSYCNRKDSVSHGNLLTEILLPSGFYCGSGLLRNLSTKGDGLVIVEDDVLATFGRSEETVRLAVTQGGRLAIKSTRDIEIAKLQIAVAQRSKIYLQAPNLIARDRIEIAGAGGSQVHLQSHNGVSTPLMKVAIAGSGSIRAQAPSFAVEEMKSAIAGSGRIVVAGGAPSHSSTTIATGECNSHGIAIFGAGDVDCADIITKRASVAVAGQGNVALEARDALTAAAFGEARLAYLHAAPRMITLKNYHASSPLGVMSEEDQRAREQQKAAEVQELEDFWSSLPTRETALAVAK